MKERIPPQFEGKTLDYSKTVDFSSTAQAIQYFYYASTKLLDINNWHHITKGPSAEFCVVSPDGNSADRRVQKGDFIRIDIPGPGLPSADGYDWVQVEEIQEEYNGDTKRLVLTLRPSPDPTQSNTDTAHFFKKIATSTFLMEQKDNLVLLRYAGRNEVINTDNESLMDNFRNFMVGIGAKLGASYPQWKALIDGLGSLELSAFPTTAPPPDTDSSNRMGR